MHSHATILDGEGRGRVDRAAAARRAPFDLGALLVRRRPDAWSLFPVAIFPCHFGSHVQSLGCAEGECKQVCELESHRFRCGPVLILSALCHMWTIANTIVTVTVLDQIPCHRQAATDVSLPLILCPLLAPAMLIESVLVGVRTAPANTSHFRQLLRGSWPGA